MMDEEDDDVEQEGVDEFILGLEDIRVVLFLNLSNGEMEFVKIMIVYDDVESELVMILFKEGILIVCQILDYYRFFYLVE